MKPRKSETTWVEITKTISKREPSPSGPLLMQLFIVKKVIPVTEKIPEKSKKGRYEICDKYFEFWFNFVFRNRRLVEEGKNNEVLSKIKRDITASLAKNYEELCCEMVRRLPMNFLAVGQWWDNSEEIDVVGIKPETKEIIFGEAKWTSKPVGTNIYAELKGKSGLVDWNKDDRKEYFALFSKSGFTKDMLKLAENEDVLLFEKDRPIRRALPD